MLNLIENLNSFFLQASPTKSSLPKMVLVDVDGVHMWYPSSLIVVQASDDLLMRFLSSVSLFLLDMINFKGDFMLEIGLCFKNSTNRI